MILVHENRNNAPKKIQKSFKIFKSSMHNGVSTGRNIAKIWLPLCPMGRVKFARYCAKMCSRHLFFLERIEHAAFATGSGKRHSRPKASVSAFGHLVSETEDV